MNIPLEKIIEWRRHIHQNPELSYEELFTSEYVTTVLESFGNIDVIWPTPTSVIGILKGSRPGRTVAFRADMDALPVQEETGLPFASVNEGVSHACGHDVHTAMLLGTAATLSSMQKQIKGTVYFIFQHAEEQSPGGALDIIETGVLDNVDAFFGLHIGPGDIPGAVGILPDGPASTASDGFYLTINGKGSHGSMPQMGRDPIVAGAEMVMALQTIVSRSVTPGEMAVITVGKFQSGNAPNVIPERALLSGTVRTISEDTRDLIEGRIKTVIESIARVHDVTCSLEYTSGYPAMKNDPVLNRLARTGALKILGSDMVFDAPRMTASEDFARYRKIAPSCYLNLSTGPGVANHHPAFNPDESALINGVKAEVQIILDYLEQK
ncbi:MAG: amidohydrolase [Bacteroidales bacterium]|jgi:amidohydrolase|nr:amidohydrolase [Bacteroidales bacterium]